MCPNIKSSSISSTIWLGSRPQELGLEAQSVVCHLHPRKSHTPKAGRYGFGYRKSLQIQTLLLRCSRMDNTSKLYPLNFMKLYFTRSDSAGYVRIGSDMAHMGGTLLTGKNQRQARRIETVKAAGGVNPLLSPGRQTHQTVFGQKVLDFRLHTQMIAQ